MEISNITEGYKLPEEKSRMTNKRQYILSQFLEEINNERKISSYGLMTGRALAIKVAHLKEHDLEYFFSQCMDYKHRQGSFGKYFFGALKPK